MSKQPEQTTEKTRRKADPEVSAMSRILGILAEFKTDAQARILKHIDGMLFNIPTDDPANPHG